ncbi:MAG: ketoacyl-ACP synthase III [Anaerolineae bacterium]|nr:ketoacyl-ACP synthase III [Anaerolineae bacterium]
MLPVKIAGLGYCLPDHVVQNAALERELGLAEGWIERVTGIRERRRATQETSAEMAAEAGRMALTHAGLDVGDLDAIVGASTGPQQLIPCTAAFVQRALGAPDGGSACFDVDATCLSFLVGLQVVSHLVAAGVYGTVLLYSSEMSRWSLNPQEPESAVLIGDAAAATVITRTPPGEASAVWRSQVATHSSGADLTAFIGGGTRHHPNDPTTTPAMNLFHMDGPAVFKQATRLAGPFLDSFFDRLGWQRDEVDWVVPHQASGMALKQLTARLGFRPDQLVVNLPTRGNCIAASLPLALAEAVHGGQVQRGQRVLLVGTGAGLSIGALALTY